jgi:hypothetical protein
VRAQQPYPPYTGEGATCPKCGNDGVSSRYQPGGQFISGTGSGFLVRGYDTPDWIARICDRCEYSWPESCVDREVP